MKKSGKMGVVAGIVAGATAAAGAYYLYYSKNAKKNRALVKEWTVKAEKEIVAEAKKLKDVAFNEKNYKAIVSAVTAKYQKLKKFEAKEAKEFTSALGSAWAKIKKEYAPKKKMTAKK